MAAGRRTRRPQRLQKRDQRAHFGWAYGLGIRRHVAASLDHLANQLIAREPRGDHVQGRAALASMAIQAVAIPALLILQNQSAAHFKWRPALQELRRDRI